MSIMTLHRHGFLRGEAGGEKMNAAYGKMLDKQIDELTTVVDRHLEVTKKIQDDKGLNAQGKNERFASTGSKARDRVFELTEQRRRMIDQDLTHAEEDIPHGLPRQSGINEAEKMRSSLRQSEIRKALLGMAGGKVVRTAEVQQAAETNDLELLLAVQDAPRIIREKIVGDETFKKAKDRFLELSKPEQFERVSTVTSALSLFEHNVQTAERIVAKASGIPLRREEAQMARAS